MNNYKEALYFIKKASKLQDSIRIKESQDKLNQLQVEYDVDQLKYEKTQLEVRNKQTVLINLVVLLSLVISLCVYLYVNLRKERKLKANMRILKTRAEESEKMKTAFMNNICHEIRTPLNSIVGFSELILDESIDHESRSTFPEEIQRNTAALTSLIDSMLEIANLDVSDEKLPCEPTDISLICYQEFDRLTKYKIPNIECKIEISESPMIVSTHDRYLTLVVENMISNAKKFTEKGTITLECKKEVNKAYIAVSDTGCGIPLDKHDTVFERFEKLNSFTQGNGLGLYLCKIIVNRISGKIYIDPNYTLGTRIVVELPIN